jgi:3'-phosphoadenosine 5'-phosphosulfate (PAPS) 3'-phosphatase
MAAPSPKIFGIGLSKTGTTSLARALEILGYKTKDYPGISRYRAGDLTSIDLEVIDAHDALTDTPIPSFYRELDQRYPGSKFILTVRESAGWLKSCKKQFTEPHAASQNDAHKQLFADLYDTIVFDEEKFRAGYDRFIGSVMAYFKERPNDLLVIDVTAGEGWEKLCPFLGEATPDIPFPKANVTEITWLKVDDVVAVAVDAGHPLMRAHRQVLSTNPLARLLLAMRGGKSAALQRAAHSSRQIVRDGLAKLNRKIPILARGGDVPSYPERAKWNHFWLVDPLDGQDAFLANTGEFTIDIALIQDGIPFLGVVHAPLSRTTYHARIRKGAFLQKGEFAPVKLEVSPPTRPADPPASGSLALRLCLAATDHPGEWKHVTPMHEGQIAAAALIANSLGRHLSECQTGQALGFNSPNMEIACLLLREVEVPDAQTETSLAQS